MVEYIEREALLERIDGIRDCNDMVFMPNDHYCNVPEDCRSCRWAEMRDAIRRIVAETPAADVRPVVHGKWIDSDEPGVPSHFSCCGYPIDCFYKTKYCSNCGALMEDCKE